MFNKKDILEKGDIDIIISEINKFKASSNYLNMIKGEQYFIGEHDIVFKQRTSIGADGNTTVIKNLPNNRIVDNQYRKMIIQKTNYLLGKPITFNTDNKEFIKVLHKIFNRQFQRVLKNICEDSLNCGIGYLHFGYDENGEIKFTRLKPYEVIPIWENREHEKLHMAIRFYNETVYLNGLEQIILKVEVYRQDGIYYYEYDKNKLRAVFPYHTDYFKINEQSYNWEKIPIIPFKYNSHEIPLIKMVKSLQDGLNTIISNFQNNMEEDARNSIMVLVNYDGENLGEFRENLATYGAVKIRNIDGNNGDVRTLEVKVNSENYKVIIAIFKKAIIENAMGYDAKDDRLSANANQLNIQSMYSDIDLDANSMETEYQGSFEQLFWFINMHLYNNGHINFQDELIEVIFNRDMLINEGDIIENLNKSINMLSKETIISNHPWVNNIEQELYRIKQEGVV